MKVSVNWVKEFTDIDLSVDELVQKIGAQLGAIEEVRDLGKSYQGIIIAKVVSCEKHPNADKLSVCQIDAGKKDLVKVVCGAPNVRKGLLVAWIPPGVTVPSTVDKDPFVLEARAIRGEMSSGMLASASELAISDDHNGIAELEKGKPGDDFAQTYGLNDYILDIENKMFTHRPDCFGILGVAREVAGIQQKPFKSPEWYLGEKTAGEHKDDKDLLVIKNELPKLVPRFMAQVFKNVEIKPSSIDIQIMLTKVGIRPINNIVDITNYMMYLTGQPLHAYDYDKVKERSQGAATIVIRHPEKGEKLKLLNGKEIEPSPEAIMIATDKELIGIGGVMGGADTEVDDNTKNIILEGANFDMYSVRRTSMTQGLFTDAVTRFNKGQSPYQIDRVLAFAAENITRESGGNPALSIYDDNHMNSDENKVQVTAEFINSRLGLNLALEQISKLLKNVEFSVNLLGPVLENVPPFWRTDIHIPEDIVEEVGRLYGYDKLPLDLPKRTIAPTSQDKDLAFKQNLREKLASFGANETLNYSFVPGKLLENNGQDPKLAYKISNALSPELEYYRLSLTPSLLEKVHPNIKAGCNEFAIFEIGKVHSNTEVDESGLPRELGRLGFVYASNGKPEGAAFYKAKEYLSQLTTLEVIPFDEKLLKGHKLSLQMAAPYDPHRSGMIWNDEIKLVVGVLGEFNQKVSKALKLPENSAGFEMFLSFLQKTSKTGKYQPLSKFPSTSQDICLQINEKITYGELIRALDEFLNSHIKQDETVSWEPIDIYHSEELGSDKRITYRVTLTSYERTLTDEVLSSLLGKLADTLAKNYNAKRI